MLGQGEGVLGCFGQQQINLAQGEESVTQSQSKLQLQGDAAVRDFDLQCMAQCPEQLATADSVGQVIVAAVFAVEQHQCAAVVQGVQFALVQRSRLVKAVAIALKQLRQTRAGQTTQLILCAKLHSKDCAVPWL